MKYFIRYEVQLSDADLAALKAFHGVEKFPPKQVEQTLMQIGIFGVKAQINQGRLSAAVKAAPPKGWFARLRDRLFAPKPARPVPPRPEPPPAPPPKRVA